MNKLRVISIVAFLFFVIFTGGCVKKNEQTKSISVCEEWNQPSKKDKCYLSFALNQSNSDLCINIQNSSIRLSCFAIVKVDFELCDKIEGISIKDNCYYSIGIYKKDILACGKIRTYFSRYMYEKC